MYCNVLYCTPSIVVTVEHGKERRADSANTQEAMQCNANNRVPSRSPSQELPLQEHIVLYYVLYTSALLARDTHTDCR
jgi:hypothetical protein